MMEDSVVREIHETRQRIFEECGGDIERLIERMKVADAKNVDRLVNYNQVEQRRSVPLHATADREIISESNSH